MHKQYHYSKHTGINNPRGFTIVEMVVVVAVIGILSAIGIAAFVTVDKKSKDDKRSADITVFQSELEKFYDKNGEYPPGCVQNLCGSFLITDNTSAPIITSLSTLSQIKATLPGLPSEFGDPTASTDGTPITLRTVSTKEYYYFGGTVNNRAASSSWSMASSSTLPCAIQSSLAVGEVGSYVVGYFSESDKKWVLRSGKQGKPMTITGGTAADGCVINKS